MASNARLDHLKRQIEKLRKDSLDLIASANKIVYAGVQKFADKELKALNDYYKTALESIKKADKTDLKGMAHQQMDLLQKTVDQVIAHARESLAVIAETRNDIAKLVQKGLRGEKVTEPQIRKAAAPAKKAVAKVKKAAKTAGKKAAKSVKKTAAPAKKAAKKAVKKVTQSVRAEPDSRAARATSRAKEAASAAASSVSTAASNLSQNVQSAVSGAVNSISDAIKSKE